MLIAALELAGARAVVVGGGAVGARRARSLLDAGADVRVVSPALHPSLDALRERVDWLAHAYDGPSCLEGARVVIVATPDDVLNLRIARDASELGCWVNVASDPDSSTLRFLATSRRGPIEVGVHTHGASPRLSRLLAARMTGGLDEVVVRGARALRALRAGVRDVLEPGARRALVSRAAEGLVERGEGGDVAAWLRACADEVGATLSDTLVDSAAQAAQVEEEPP